MKTLLMIMLLPFCAFSQYRGIIKDSITKRPIAKVGIWCTTKSRSFSANNNGMFKTRELSANDELVFFTKGYELKRVLCTNVRREVLLVPKKPGREIARPARRGESQNSALPTVKVQQKNRRSEAKRQLTTKR